ncbi:unnamed protein product [Arctia plantaginis]|uniref:Uncharacterized protein n=1 Tax=Arctia plantaginis TaxID=874455 RepID=A0A8S1A8M3_ARCPL|nr:unnamed protein product [Arctia plantaginis]
MAIDSNSRGLLGMLRNIPVADNTLAIKNTDNANIINNVANFNTATNAVTMAESNLINVNTGPNIPTNFNKLESEKMANTNFIQDAEVFKLLKDPVNKSTLANNILANNDVAGGLRTQSLNLKIGNPCNCKNAIQGNIGNQDFGFQIAPDNLEILGTVTVIGRLPLHSVVAINGNIPTNGQGSVNFSSSPRTNSVSL